MSLILFIILWECGLHTRAGHSREVDLFFGSSLSLQTTVCSTRNTWNTEWIRIHSLCCQSESSNSIRACRKNTSYQSTLETKRFIHSTNIKNKAPPLHTSMEVISYHANNDNRHIKFVIHYTVLNVYPWFCVNCIQ